MAWLTNWNRRKQLYINSTNSAILSSYQIQITVYYGTGTDSAGNIYCNNNCKTDFSDIRFTDSSGNNLLYYWIQSYTASSSATIWIKIPTITMGSNSTYIYIYYNNPTPPSDGYNSGTNTFIFFDNFSSSTNWSLNPTYASISGGTLNITETQGVGVGPYAVYKSQLTIPYIMEYDVILMGWGGSEIRWFDVIGVSSGIYASSSESLGCGYFKTSYQCYSPPCLINRVYSRYYDVYTPGANFNTGIWYHSIRTVTGTFDTLNVVGQPSSTNNVAHTNRYVGFGASYSYSKYANFFIRQYASPIPIWSSTIGVEQNVIFNISSTPSGAEIWIASPTNTTYADQHIQTNTTVGVQAGTTYDILVGLGGYQQWTLVNICGGNCTVGSVYNIQADLVPLPGSLSVSSTPTDAEIFLALQPDNPLDQEITTIPAGKTISNLTPGIYNVKLTLTGYQDWTGTVTVTSQQTTSLSATFSGSANITSIPIGAATYLDGEITSKGNTPLIIANLTSTTSGATTNHNYILKLTGYADTSGSFTATAGTTVNVPVMFPGSLYITSIPIGAQIYIDDILQL